MVYAFRYGKAIVVSPLINAVAPAITVLLSLILYRTGAAPDRRARHGPRRDRLLPDG
jgi:hypothetical protein